MKLTIRNYNIMAGVKVIDGWKLVEVKEYDDTYEFHCQNILTDEDRYLRLDREYVLTTRICWSHSANRGPNMDIFKTWPGAVNEIAYELNWLITR